MFCSSNPFAFSSFIRLKVMPKFLQLSIISGTVNFGDFAIVSFLDMENSDSCKEKSNFPQNFTIILAIDKCREKR